MAGKSNIEWTGHTWNPLAGCTILTSGCSKCYAMKMAARLAAMGQELYAGLTEPSKAGPVWTGVLRQAPEHVLLAPLKRKKPTTYFVNSMSDLFHENVPDEWIDRVFAVMALCQQHTFQVLTKRAARMRDYIGDSACSTIGKGDVIYRVAAAQSQLGYDNIPSALRHHWPLRNVWLGTSTERQQEADLRIPLLLNTPAAVRFLSVEPMLGPIDLTRICIQPQKPGSHLSGIHINALTGNYCESGVVYTGQWDVSGPAPPDSERRRIDWTIVGGESGHGARELNLKWIRDIVAQCAAADTRCFVKQLGGYVVGPHANGVDLTSYRFKNKKGGDPSEWPIDLRVREMPRSAP